MATTFIDILNRAQDIALRFGKKWEDLDPTQISNFIKAARREISSLEIEFPEWVTEPTECALRSFSTVIPQTDRYASTRHGAIRFERQFENRPTVLAPRRGLPGFYTKWADEK